MYSLHKSPVVGTLSRTWVWECWAGRRLLTTRTRRTTLPTRRTDTTETEQSAPTVDLLTLELCPNCFAQRSSDPAHNLCYFSYQIDLTFFWNLCDWYSMFCILIFTAVTSVILTSFKLFFIYVNYNFTNVMRSNKLYPKQLISIQCCKLYSLSSFF